MEVNYLFLLLGGLSTVQLGTAKVCLTNAMIKGPTGPIIAICTATTIVTLTLASCVRHHELIRLLEFIGIVICIMGSLVLAIPDKL